MYIIYYQLMNNQGTVAFVSRLALAIMLIIGSQKYRNGKIALAKAREINGTVYGRCMIPEWGPGNKPISVEIS